METIDRQLAGFKNKLVEEVQLTEEQATKVGTLVKADVLFLSQDVKDLLRSTSPIDVQHRLEELKGFQGFMDYANTIRQNPFIVRAQVIVQNYICFVYLVDSCFMVLRKNAPQDSVARKCAKFLTDNPIRAFRNAVAHGNWHYAKDYSSIIYWARKGFERDDPLDKFNVSNDELGFWQMLSRTVAYATYLNL